MKMITAALALSLLGACATTSGSDATVSVSGFSGSKVVNIEPHGNACKQIVCTGLGAQWSAERPDVAVLTVAVFNQIKGITGAKLNIDGEVVELSSAQAFSNFDSQPGPMKTSRRPFVVPVSLIERITAGNRVWLRVMTTDGALEDAIIDGGSDSKSYHALKRFMQAVKG